jgi:hypothetical protein
MSGPSRTVWAVTALAGWEAPYPVALFDDEADATILAAELNADPDDAASSYEVARMPLYRPGSRPYRITVWTGWAIVHPSGKVDGPSADERIRVWDFDHDEYTAPTPLDHTRDFRPASQLHIVYSGSDRDAVLKAVTDRLAAETRSAPDV